MVTVSADVRLLALPIAGRVVASSRLRCHDLVAALPARFRTTLLEPDPAPETLRAVDPRDFDLVYVQKDARPETLALARRTVEAGVPLVYDIDDDFGCWPGMDEASMVKLATSVTVDSVGRAGAVGHAATGPVTVLPCMIDQADDPRRLVHQTSARSIGTVASFGNLVSLVETLPHLAAVTVPRTFVIGPPDSAAELPGVRVVPFDLRTFVPALLEADVFILAHGPAEAPFKDNNRLIMALSLGKVSLVSRSPAYLDVLAALDAGWLAGPPDDVPDRLARLADPDERAVIEAAGAEYAWARYRPAACATRFARLVDTMLGGQ
jgi:hypothetical protein